MNFRSIRFLCFLVVLAFIQLNAQNTVTIVYSFDSDMSALVWILRLFMLMMQLWVEQNQNNGTLMIWVSDLFQQQLETITQLSLNGIFTSQHKASSCHRLQINEIKVTQRS